MTYLPIYDSDQLPVDVSLPTITPEFLLQSDVFVMTPQTLGSDGTVNTWPNAFINPQTTGKRYILITPGNYLTRKSPNYNDGRLMPFQGGTVSNPVYYIGVKNTTDQLTLQNLHPAFKTEQEQAIFPFLMLLGSSGIYSVNWSRYVGIDFRNGMGQLTSSASNHVIKWCSCASQSQSLRIRSGASYNTVSECLLWRPLPFTTLSDVVCIQFSDGPAWLNNVIEYNTIIGYTDQLQTTDRVNYGAGGSTDYGFAAGLRVNNNFMGYFPEYHENNGTTSKEGLEQSGWDLKTGGTVNNRCRFFRNVVFGNRPNVRTPGYAVTIHRVFNYADFDENVFTDNESAIFLNVQYINANNADGIAANRLRVRGNVFSDCRDRGSNFFAGKRGRVYVGLATFEEFSGNVIYRCDNLSEAAPHASWQAVQPMAISGNTWQAPTSFGSGLFVHQAAWEAAGNVVEEAPELVATKIGVPFTDRTVPINVTKPRRTLRMADQSAAESAATLINSRIGSLLTLNKYTLTDGGANVFAKKNGVDTQFKIPVFRVVVTEQNGVYYITNPASFGNHLFSFMQGPLKQLMAGITPVPN